MPGHDGGERKASRAEPLPAAIDLTAHDRNRLLVDLCGVPGLDGSEVGFARLIAGAGAPAVRFQEVRGRRKRAGSALEIADAIFQHRLRQKLRLTDLAMHRATLTCRYRAALDELQRGIKLIGEIFRPPAVIGERCDRGEHVLVAPLAAEPAFRSEE